MKQEILQEVVIFQNSGLIYWLHLSSEGGKEGGEQLSPVFLE